MEEFEYKAKQKEKNKKRNFYKKVGASALTVFSLFGLSNAFLNGFNQGSISRVKRKIKLLNKDNQKEVKKNLETEIDKNIDQEMQKVTVQEQENYMGTSRYGTLTKIIVYSTWVSIMGVFVSSLFFNFPFALGYAVLKILPGEPHTVELKLNSEKKEIGVGEEFEVDLLVSTSYQNINMLKTNIVYDSSILKVISLNDENSALPKKIQNSYNNKEGLIVIERGVDNEEKMIKDFSKIVSIKFKVIGITQETFVDISESVDNKGGNKDGSWAYKKEGNINYLSETEGIYFSILKGSKEQKIGSIPEIKDNVSIDGDLKDWQDVFSEESFFSNENEGYFINYLDIKRGVSSGEEDIKINFNLGEKDGEVYLIAYIVDDNFTDKDYFEVLNKNESYTFYMESLSDFNYVVKDFEDYKVLEARLPLKKDNIDFDNLNFQFLDYDLDNSEGLHAFSY